MCISSNKTIDLGGMLFTIRVYYM